MKIIKNTLEEEIEIYCPHCISEFAISYNDLSYEKYQQMIYAECGVCNGIIPLQLDEIPQIWVNLLLK